MGNFDTSAHSKYSFDRSRTILGQSVGPNAINASKDLHLIVRTLMNAGLLEEGATVTSTRRAVYAAIQQVRQSLQNHDVLSKNQSNDVHPGDMVELAVRAAIVQGRLPLSHRIISESTLQKEPRKLIDGGMTRALQRLNAPKKSDLDLKSPHRRALLPTISAQTFQANRRLAEAFTQGEDIKELVEVIANTISENGKQGYSDVKDFMGALSKSAPDIAKQFGEDVQSQLNGKVLRRFHKLLINQPPVENDFDDPPLD